MYTDFQTRLSGLHDNIRRKIIDRQLALQGHVTDCIRVRTTKNKEGDIISHIIVAADIVHVSFGPMKDVPIRELQNQNGRYVVTSLISAVGALEQEVPQHYTIQAPRSEKIQVGDYIFRVMLEADMEFPIVLGLEITEKLATFGANSVTNVSYKVAIYMQDLPDKMVEVISSMAKRRLHLRY